MSPQVITPEGNTYEKYVEDRESRILDCVIEPQKIKVTLAWLLFSKISIIRCLGCSEMGR
jgi:hypothetical protein